MLRPPASTELSKNQGLCEVRVAEIIGRGMRVLASRFDGAIVVSKGARPRAQNEVAKAYERPDVIRLDTQGHAISHAPPLYVADRAGRVLCEYSQAAQNS